MKVKDLGLFFLLRYAFWISILPKCRRFPRLADWVMDRIAHMLQGLPVRIVDELLGNEEGDDECDE